MEAVRLGLAVTLGVLVLGVLFGGIANASEDTGPSLPAEASPPIVVVGDEGPTGFTLAASSSSGEPVYRPGSGVVEGNGTPENPFVIKDRDASRIVLADTSAHVRIENVTVRGSQESAQLATRIVAYDTGVGGIADERRHPTNHESGSAFLLEDAQNVTIASSDIEYEHTGLEIRNSTNVTLEGNQLDHAGASIPGPTEDEAPQGSEVITITRHHGETGLIVYWPWFEEPTEGAAILVNETKELEATGNHVQFWTMGMGLQDSDEIHLEGNHFESAFWRYGDERADGVLGHDVRQVTMRENTFDDVAPQLSFSQGQAIEIVDHHLENEGGPANLIEGSKNVRLENTTTLKGFTFDHVTDLTLEDLATTDTLQIEHASDIDAIAIELRYGADLRLTDSSQIGVENVTTESPVSYRGANVVLTDVHNAQLEGFQSARGNLEMENVTAVQAHDVVLDQGSVSIEDLTDATLSDADLDRGSLHVDGAHASELKRIRLDEGSIHVHESQGVQVGRTEALQGGLFLDRSEDIVIDDIELGTPGFDVEGDQRSHFNHAIDGLTAGGEPVDYGLDAGDVELELGRQQVFLVGAGNVTARPHPTEPMEHGFTTLQARNVTVEGLEAKGLHDPLEASGEGTLSVQAVNFTEATGTLLDAEGFTDQRIQDAMLQGQAAKQGLRFVGGGSVTAENVTVRGAGVGSTFDGSTDVALSSSSFIQTDPAIHLVETTDVSLEDNRIQSPSASKGIVAKKTQDLQVVANEIHGGDDWKSSAIRLSHTGPTLVEANEVNGFSRTIYATDAPELQIHQNRFDDTVLLDRLSSDHVDADPGLEASNNTWKDPGRALTIGKYHPVQDESFFVRDNEIQGAMIAFWIGNEVGSREHGFHGNNFNETEYGFYFWIWPGNLQAQDNWWGCPDGPNTQGCADTWGSDDHAEYEPWLNEPNPDAGVD